MVSEGLDTQESNSLFREQPENLGSVLCEGQGGCGETAVSEV